MTGEARALLALTATLCAVACLAAVSDPVRVWADATMPWLLGGAGLLLVGAGALAEWLRQGREYRRDLADAERAAQRKRVPR